MNREKVKMLILLSETVEEADEIIVNAGYINTREKIAYLNGMFDVKLMGRFNSESANNEKSDLMDYYALLSTIINSKWGV